MPSEISEMSCAKAIGIYSPWLTSLSERKCAQLSILPESSQEALKWPKETRIFISFCGVPEAEYASHLIALKNPSAERPSHKIPSRQAPCAAATGKNRRSLPYTHRLCNAVIFLLHRSIQNAASHRQVAVMAKGNIILKRLICRIPGKYNHSS